MSDRGEQPERDPRDEGLVDELRALAAGADPVPLRVLEAARLSYSWRTIDAELAELAYDSVMDDERLALVRSGEGPRLLTFECPQVTVEVEVTAVGGTRKLVGQIVPERGAEVEVRHKGGVVTVAADDLGRFSAEGVESGPIGLRLRLGGRPALAIETDWLTV